MAINPVVYTEKMELEGEDKGGGELLEIIVDEPA